MKLIFCRLTNTPNVYRDNCMYVNIGWIGVDNLHVFEFLPDTIAWSNHEEALTLTEDVLVWFISLVITQQPKKIYINKKFGSVWQTENGIRLLNTLKEMSE